MHVLQDYGDDEGHKGNVQLTLDHNLGLTILRVRVHCNDDTAIVSLGVTGDCRYLKLVHLHDHT